MATIVVTSTAGTVETSEGSFDLRADDEYWFVSSDALNRISAGSSGTLTLLVEGDYNYRNDRGGETWAGNVTGFQLVQNTPAPATWRSASNGFPSGAIVFEAADQSVALALLLQQDPTANSTGFRRVDFFQTGSNPLFYQNRAAVYTMAQRSSAGAPNSRYNQAISDFELFADLV
ncbi:MAG: hypothetical protein IPK82_41060 [Polyangiaceae bacterium]|nr:hypothetical protein [Polyangiaceae bacterium]